MRTSLIVAAGGSGSRFQKTSPLPGGQYSSKLFFPLCGKPLLAHTVEAFQKISQVSETILAVPEGAQSEARRLVRERGWQAVRLVRGGRTRAESVWKALRKANPRNKWVTVHDGARPFTSPTLLKKLFQGAENSDGVILAKKIVPTIKEADGKGFIRRTVDRRVLFEAQTPQVVRRELLEEAYRKVPKAFEATDEASLLEAVGAEVRIFIHEDWNPKITTYHDLELAEAYLHQKNKVITTTGIGRDTHRLVDGRPLILGGVEIPFEKGPLGHSDGDVLLHAVIDAILGAAGEGDIGEWFSDKDPKNKGIAGKFMLQTVLKKIVPMGWKIQHLDSTVFLERPKLSPYKEKLRRSIAELLSIPQGYVSVKAKTMEGLGPEGQGLAVTAEALVTLQRIVS